MNGRSPNTRHAALVRRGLRALPLRFGDPLQVLLPQHLARQVTARLVDRAGSRSRSGAGQLRQSTSPAVCAIARDTARSRPATSARARCSRRAPRPAASAGPTRRGRSGRMRSASASAFARRTRGVLHAAGLSRGVQIARARRRTERVDAAGAAQSPARRRRAMYIGSIAIADCAPSTATCRRPPPCRAAAASADRNRRTPASRTAARGPALADAPAARTRRGEERQHHTGVPRHHARPPAGERA